MLTLRATEWNSFAVPPTARCPSDNASARLYETTQGGHLAEKGAVTIGVTYGISFTIQLDAGIAASP
jgi:hypothetical protein